MSALKPQQDWARLFRIARALIRQVNSEQPLIDHWTLGGGTALMLQIDHRESHDAPGFEHLMIVAGAFAVDLHAVAEGFAIGFLLGPI